MRALMGAPGALLIAPEPRSSVPPVVAPIRDNGAQRSASGCSFSLIPQAKPRFRPDSRSTNTGATDGSSPPSDTPSDTELNPRDSEPTLPDSSAVADGATHWWRLLPLAIGL